MIVHRSWVLQKSLHQEPHNHMHSGTYLVVLKYAEIVMVTHISLSIYLHTKQGQRRVLEFGGDEVIILRNILCQIHDWSEIWKSCQNVVGTIPLAPIYSTSPGQSKSGIDRFSRIFGKVFSRGNFWVLCIFACKKIRPGENFSCNKAISKPDVWAFEETFWSRHSKLQPNLCVPSTVNTWLYNSGTQNEVWC